MAITRIKTNQITDANITTAKIADNAITAGKLAANITYGSDFAVTGNLTVSGTTTTVSTANTRIEDAILALAAEATGSASNDAGILINRGADDNQALLWDESADQFVLANVGSDVGDTAGNVSISSYAGLQAGAIVYGSLNDGTTTLTSTAAELNLVDGSSAGTILNSKAVIYGSGGEVNATKLQVGGVDITSTPAEINLLDTAAAGTIVNSIAVIYGAAGEVNATTLQVGGVDITATPAEINVLDGVTAGTVLASGGVVVDANKDISSFRNLTATGAITGGSFVIGSADISEAELETIDGVTAGTVAASKAVVVDANKDVTGFRNVTATGAITGGSFVIGSADISEAELETIDGVTAGTASASKALVLDGSSDISGINDISAAGLTLSDLTDNRIVIAGTSGLLEDSASLTFDGTTFEVGTKFDVVSSTGETTIGGTLNANGAVNLGDGADDAIAVLGTATFTPSATFNGGFTTASGQTVTFGATNTISAGSNKITGVADPVADQDAATKAYVDSQVASDGSYTDGTTSVSYGVGDTTTFSGTANETTVVVSGTSGSPTITIGLPDDVTIAGNLTVSGTTTTVDSTTTVLEDPVMRLGVSGLGADAGKDRGIEFLYYDGSEKTGFFGWDNSADSFVLITDATNTSEVFSGTAGAATFGAVTGSSFTIGSASINETELETIDGVTAGTVAASKALVVDANKDIATLRNVTISGSLIHGSVDLDGTDLAKLDGITDGTGAANKALVLDASSNVSTGGVVTATGFTIGSASIVELDLEQIEDITAGTVAASKAVVVDANKDVTGFRNVTATGSFIIGSADMSEADLELIDGLTAGTVAASKAVTVDANKDVSSFRNLTATGAITGGSFVIGSADISEAELETIDGVTAGTASASKALVLDGSSDISGINDIGAAGLTLSDLTDNRIVIAGTSGLLEDDANFTFDGTTFTVGGADSTVFSATVAGVVNIDGAATVDGLASLDGGINTNDDFTVDTDGNVVGVAATFSGLTSADGGIDVNSANFAVSTAGIVTTVEAIQITADNKQLEIGAKIGGDFRVSHNGTDTTITNVTGNLAIDGAASSAIRVNEAGADVDFVVEGDTNTALFVVDAGSDTVAVGGAASGDAAFQVNSTGAMLLPHGDTTARNALTGETGMLRFNTTINDLEFYNNSGWTTVSVDYTVATSQTFSGDDSTTAFTLSSLTGSDSYTTAGVLVMLNGVVQQPTEVYGVSGTTLTFTTAPATGDLIEVRKFTTASSINAMSDADGDTQIQVEESADEDIIRFDIAGSQIARIESTGIILDSGKTFQGTATSAQYADLAEMYASDEEVEVGTVVHFVGEGKVGACDTDACRSVAGVVSTDPAYLMNSAQDGVALALAGRVPTKVTGPVAAGDLMVSAGNGMARAEANPALGTVIGKAIEANEGGEGVIEVLVMMM
jgi:hypothetical protein